MGLRPRFKSPFSQARDKIIAYALRPLMAFKPRTRFLIACSILVLLTTLLLLTNRGSSFNENYQIGEVLSRSIVAPTDLTAVDQAETERRKNIARETTRPFFNFDSSRGETSVQSFRSDWEELKTQATSSQNKSLVWNGEGGPPVAQAIVAHNFNEADLDRIASILRESSAGYIYDDADTDRLRREIVLDDVHDQSSPVVVLAPLTGMKALSTARRNLEQRIVNLPGWSAAHKTALNAALAPLIRPNVAFDQAATVSARESEAGRVEPVVISLKRNQVVAREGDTVTPGILAQIAAIKSSGHSGRPWHNFFGLLLVVTAVYWVAWKFAEHRSGGSTLILTKHRAFALVGSALLVQTALMKVGFTFGDSMAARMQPPFNDPVIWNFAIPYAAAALLVAMLVDTQLAFLTGIITALFAGMLAPTGMQKALFAMVSCSSAIYGIGRYRERQSVTLAGLLVGAVNVVMAIALMAYSEQPLTLRTFLLAAGAGVVGGLLTAVFAAGGLPINESLFGILTDVKLLELSNADLPVLGQLAMRAPGTNQHSHAVGQLAEDACRAVGANPLLARIGALYHDIGKLAAPEYFVENQQGDNPHDRLRPYQSAKIITSHVTYGARLAKEIGLPQTIADFIPQHHGTRTLHYFLRKAQAQAKPGETVDEADFRYPGPKPQFKEAAIMMLADSCEAAARSLARPDPENIRAIVVKIFDAIISDGQLDQCDVTLQELRTIREAMISALTAIYHARIDYPGFNAPTMTGPLPPLPAGNLDSEERGITYSKPSEVPISRGGEVEDEAVPRRVSKR
ncbi:MAG TPA: HDIG domain-containing protein [Pyrinomonadaceae bacterium]|nr:HDIG domain-containing protein [Pyrinomonadaceae bacterium]